MNTKISEWCLKTEERLESVSENQIPSAKSG